MGNPRPRIGVVNRSRETGHWGCGSERKDIDVLERVQRRATKSVHTMSQLPYESRLEHLKLYSLFCRRQRGDMIETYKILNGYYRINPSLFFTLNTSSSTRGHSLKLFKNRSLTTSKAPFFLKQSSQYVELFTRPSCLGSLSSSFQAAAW